MPTPSSSVIPSPTLSLTQLLPTLPLYSSTLPHLPYSPQQPQSAVAIIIRPTSSHSQSSPLSHQPQPHRFIHDQILLLQRRKSPRDRFSGEICFPGGRQEEGETLMETVVRETFEETGILLKEEWLVGGVDRQVNFIISTKKKGNNRHNRDTKGNNNCNGGENKKEDDENNYQGNNRAKNAQHPNPSNPTTPSTTTPTKEMTVYAFVFCLPSQQDNQTKITLNQHEMSTYKWLPVEQLTRSRNVCWLDYTGKVQSLTTVYHHHPIIKQHHKSSLHSITRALSPALDVGMDQKLYGITLYMVLILLTGVMKWAEGVLKKEYIKDEGTGGQQFGNKTVNGDSEVDYRFMMKRLVGELKLIRNMCEAYVVFEVDQPINDEFRMFENALKSAMYKMRPKL